MKRGISVCRLLSALALAALPRTAQSDEMKDVSCEGFDLSYDGQAATVKCFELHQYGNQTEMKTERLIAKGASYEMIVTYSAGKFRTYFPMRPLREQIDNAGYFSDTDNWLATKQFAGFEIAVFEGFEKAGDPPILCAGFSRYSGVSSGPYEYEGGPGYRNHAAGLYCAFSGQAALLNPPDNFYRVVEAAIGKFHLPQ